MSESFKETLNLLKDSDLSDFSKFSSRGIEKESLRVFDKTISLTDHPTSLGATLTNQYITTDFSEALLELITNKKNSIDESLSELEDVLNFVFKNCSETIWPSSVPCTIEDENKIRIAEYGSSNSGRLKNLYRKGLSERYGSMMQCVSGIHYNFSLNDEFFLKLAPQNTSLQEFKNESYLSLVRNFRRNAWLLLYLFGASPIVPKSFIAGRQNFLQNLNDQDCYLENATCLRMSELGYMSNAQDNLFIAYNNLDEYVENLLYALKEKFPRYEQIGIEKEGEFIQINDSIIQIENEYYSSIRPKRIVGSGERPINALKEKGIEYVEVRCMDNNPFEPLGISAETSHFLEAYLMTCLADENKFASKEEIVEIQTNWQNVVKDGRNPDLNILVNGKEINIRDAANSVLEKIKIFNSSITDKADNLKTNITNSIALQEKKIENSDLTPSGKILKIIKDNDMTWTDFNLELYEEHKRYFSSLTKNLSYLEEEAKTSLVKFNELEKEEEIPFADFLKNYLNALN
ncbi:MAG: glutamate--cysteine ligase [Pseudomonadota bacterium]|nr:glutamate--cysteine ligase [Pseudomonadota bacterium]MEC9193551.1 glutamate--cysteine ligase [Pseudomonadota bacterium]